jgi:HPt (histidine-containing phosphotransfer) domain-containing protein
MATTMHGVDPAIIEPRALDTLVRFGGTGLLKSMIKVFLADAPLRIAKARDGATARDAGAVERAMHALKSSAGQMGAMHMVDLCAAGESLAARGQRDELSALVAEVEAEFESARDQLERVLADAMVTDPAADSG